MLSLMMVALLLATGGFEWVRSRVLVAANVRLEDSLRETVSKASFKTTLLTGNPEASSQAMNDLIGLRQFVTGNRRFRFYGCAMGSNLHWRHVPVPSSVWYLQQSSL